MAGPRSTVGINSGNTMIRVLNTTYNEPASSGTAGTTFTMAPGVTTGGIAIIGVFSRGADSAPSSVTWDGVAATLLSSGTVQEDSSHYLNLHLYSVEPTTVAGADIGEVSVTFPSTMSQIYVNVACFYGTTFVSTATIVTSTGTSTNPGVSISSGAGLSMTLGYTGWAAVSSAYPPLTFTYPTTKENSSFYQWDADGISEIGQSSHNTIIRSGWHGSSEQKIAWEQVVYGGGVPSTVPVSVTYVAAGFTLDPQYELFTDQYRQATAHNLLIHFIIEE